MFVTRVPRRILSVHAPRADSSVQPSSQGSPGYQRFVKWSATQALSSPSSSRYRQRSYNVVQKTFWIVMTPKRGIRVTPLPSLGQLRLPFVIL
jgi:hypothetical protein